MARQKRNGNENTPQVIPGMRSDSEPQPKQDPDFGPGMEYESGDRNRDFSEADKIRQQWTEGRKQPSRAKPRRPAKRAS